jgi:hypothetical protein
MFKSEFKKWFNSLRVTNLKKEKIENKIFFLRIFFKWIKLKRSLIINGLLQYFGNTSCHYQAKISKESFFFKFFFKFVKSKNLK